MRVAMPRRARSLADTGRHRTTGNRTKVIVRRYQRARLAELTSLNPNGKVHGVGD